MNAQDFEQRIAETPFRPMPHGWREEILATAALELDEDSSKNLAPIDSWIGAWLKPMRLGWLGLAACWCLILFFNHAAAPEPMTLGVNESGVRSPQSSWRLHQEALVQHLREEEAPVQRSVSPGIGWYEESPTALCFV